MKIFFCELLKNIILKYYILLYLTYVRLHLIRSTEIILTKNNSDVSPRNACQGNNHFNLHLRETSKFVARLTTLLGPHNGRLL